MSNIDRAIEIVTAIHKCFYNIKSENEFKRSFWSRRVSSLKLVQLERNYPAKPCPYIEAMIVDKRIGNIKIKQIEKALRTTIARYSDDTGERITLPAHHLEVTFNRSETIDEIIYGFYILKVADPQNQCDF